MKVEYPCKNRHLNAEVVEKIIKLIFLKSYCPAVFIKVLLVLLSENAL